MFNPLQGQHSIIPVTNDSTGGQRVKNLKLILNIFLLILLEWNPDEGPNRPKHVDLTVWSNNETNTRPQKVGVWFDTVLPSLFLIE